MTAVRPLVKAERERADAVLPFSRLDRPRTEYLVAWDGEEPIGHVCIEWSRPPELQDLWVLPERRGRGVGTELVAAVEQRVAARGHVELKLTVGIANTAAARLYGRLGYTRTTVPPKRVQGTILLRGAPLEIDDTLLEYAKAVVSA